MPKIASILRSHPLLWATVVAVIPALVMLGLQYVWLTRLARTSAIAQKAALHNYLESLGTEVELFYRSTGERLLNIPAALFVGDNIGRIGSHWKNKPHDGVRRLFVVDYTKTPTGNFFIYDPETYTLTPTPASDESLAIVLAALPWQSQLQIGGTARLEPLQVNEHDPLHRIILSPIVDDERQLVGLAGMILNIEYFRETLLTTIIESTFPAFLSETTRDDLVLSVHDASGEKVVGSSPTVGAEAMTTLRFHFAFTDWTLRLSSPEGGNPEQWAHGTFAFNMTLGFLLAIALLGGVGMALWSARRAVRLSEMKSDFVSNVSHELRTPLASIRIFAELLTRGKANPDKVREYGGRIESESVRLSRLIDNILDFSRIESQEKEYRFEPTDVADLVGGVVETLRLRLEQDGYSMHLDLSDELPTLALDADAIRQAVHNLIDNAAKYSTAPAEIEVRVRAEEQCITISVTDRGIGIAKQDQGKIFDRFHRVGTGLVHDVKGSGLGLAIVAHICSAHGGTVEVESKPRRGSTFTIRLPHESGKLCPGADRPLATP